MHSLVRGFRQLIYPATCARCSILLPNSDGDFCSPCATTLTLDPHFTCPRCTSSVGEQTDVSEGCPRCRDDRYAFDSAFRLGPYDGLLRDSILSMKGRTGETLAECVGRLWAEHHEARFRALGSDLVIPVPLHWWRRLRRGYNQGESLSAAVASRLRIEHRPGWLRRVRPTLSQAHLAPTVRRENVKNAFRATRWSALSARRVLLIDDVLTTGSTASDAARALKKAGASRVDVAVLAHR